MTMLAGQKSKLCANNLLTFQQTLLSFFFFKNITAAPHTGGHRRQAAKVNHIGETLDTF